MKIPVSIVILISLSLAKPALTEECPGMESYYLTPEGECLEFSFQQENSPTTEIDRDNEPNGYIEDNPVYSTQEGMSQYLENVKSTIQDKWNHEIKNINIETYTQVVIEFSIDRQGNVNDAEIASSSGDREVDIVAWNAVITSHFPPIPKEHDKPTLDISFSFTTRIGY